MPRALRSRAFVVTMLTAFVLAQPAAWCSALCLLERHHAAEHPAGPGHASVTPPDCHTARSGAVEHRPLPTLSPMVPEAAARIAAAPGRWVEPAPAIVVAPHDLSRTAESPPPRLV
jgi:hypothetical protein